MTYLSIDSKHLIKIVKTHYNMFTALVIYKSCVTFLQMKILKVKTSPIESHEIRGTKSTLTCAVLFVDYSSGFYASFDLQILS